MPSRKVHEHLDMLLFGRRYSWLHRWMDKPYKRLGKKHRRIRHDPWHTPIQALIMSGGDWKAYASAAKTVKEASELIEKGFEYVCEIESVKLFRKRK